MYSVVDLFAGAGGLSLGFIQTGKYTVRAAVENNPHAQETYRQNHQDIDLYSDVRDVDYKEILRKNTSIDVVIGGPPCQGFSNANRQRNQLINMNNQLVKEYVRAICELHPRAFVMENVQMLKSDTHRFYCTERDKESGILEKYSILIEDKYLDLLPETLYFDALMDLCRDIEQLNKYIWQPSTFQTLNLLRRYENNPQKLDKSFEKYFDQMGKICDELASVPITRGLEKLNKDALKLAEEIKKYKITENPAELTRMLNILIPIQRLFYYIMELSEKKILYELIHEKGINAKVKSYAVCDYIKGVLESPEYNYNIISGTLNAAEFGVPQKRHRFVLIGIRDGEKDKLALPKGTFTTQTYRKVKDAIEDLADVRVHYEVNEDPEPAGKKEGGTNELQLLLSDTDLIHNHVVTKTREVALSRFAALKAGQNFHDLDKAMKENTYTDCSKTQNSIYQRLNYSEPSGTVLNVRKSMWIHPEIDRAISIREAARLQTFPDSYIFYGTKDAQYQQIGNAVPPLLGKAIAEKVAEMLFINE